MMDADTGWGVAAMGNSDNFTSVYRQMIATLAKSYGYDLAETPLPLRDELIILASLRGTRTALDAYQRMKASGFNQQEPTSQPLNALGYHLLAGHLLDDAIRVFQRNVAEFPQDANTYDSLAEAFMATGMKEQAIQNYEASLKLNPKNDNAVIQLEKLRQP